MMMVYRTCVILTSYYRGDPRVKGKWRSQHFPHYEVFRFLIFRRVFPVYRYCETPRCLVVIFVQCSTGTSQIKVTDRSDAIHDVSFLKIRKCHVHSQKTRSQFQTKFLTRELVEPPVGPLLIFCFLFRAREVVVGSRVNSKSKMTKSIYYYQESWDRVWYILLKYPLLQFRCHEVSLLDLLS